MIVYEDLKRLELAVREVYRLTDRIGFTDAINKVSKRWEIGKQRLIDACDEWFDWCDWLSSERLN